MKRSRVGLKTGNMVQVPEGEQGFWPSYADMMSSFALILFFLMLISYLQNLITGNQLVSTQDRLKQTEDTLSITLMQVDEAKDRLNDISIQLSDAEAAILLQQNEMAEYAATIDGQTATILEQTARIDEQTILLDDQLKQIAAQKEYIALTNDELIKLRSQMQTIALLRLSILDKIKESIATTLGDATKVRIADNGSIILNEGLFFDYNSASIKSQSYPLLDELTDSFVQFLSEEENAKYVDSIVISGHTDDTGTAARNRSLSTERANAVLDYLLEKNGGKLGAFERFFCAAGYGATRPVDSNKTTQGRSNNRRIEISIILRDETVLQIVDSYLRQEMPITATAG